MAGIEKEEIHWKPLTFKRKDYATNRADAWGVALHAATFRQWREKDRRVQPADLIWSPTNMPRQKTVTETGLLKSFTYSSGLKIQSHTPPSPAYLGPPEIDTHWEVPMRLKVKERSQNLAQDLAEYRQTCSLFSSLARGVADLHGTIRGRKTKRKKVTRKNFACDVSGKVLATNFGLLPTLSSLGQAAETLALKLEQPHVRRFAVTKKKSEKLDGWNGDFSRSDRAVFYVTFDVNKSDFSFGNPLELAYELTPYSFVLDWMFPVGDYLASLDALNGTSGIVGSVSTKYSAPDLRYDPETSLNQVPEGYVLEIAPRASYESTERNVYSTIPQAKMSSMLEYTPSTSFHSVVNGLALLVGLNDSCGHVSKPPRPHFSKPPRSGKPWVGTTH